MAKPIILNNPLIVKDQQIRQQQIAQGGISREIKDLPDAVLVDILVLYGQPRWSAQELRTNPQARALAVKFWCDVQDAREGDREAKMRVDLCREMWANLRKEELITDNPNRMHTELINPLELL